MCRSSSLRTWRAARRPLSVTLQTSTPLAALRSVREPCTSEASRHGGEYFAPDLRGSYVVTQSVALDDPTSAITFSCWYDASILLGPVDATGQPAVLNDKIISVRQKQALYFDGTDWKVGEAATVQDLGDGNQCPPPDTAS